MHSARNADMHPAQTFPYFGEIVTVRLTVESKTGSKT